MEETNCYALEISQTDMHQNGYVNKAGGDITMNSNRGKEVPLRTASLGGICLHCGTMKDK